MMMVVVKMMMVVGDDDDDGVGEDEGEQASMRSSCELKSVHKSDH